MPTLHRHLAKRFLLNFAGTLLVLGLTVLIVDMLLHIDEITESAGGIAEAIELLGLRTAALYLPYLLPVATFVAAFLTAGLAARSWEIVAIKAAGISPLWALAPLLLAAAGIAGVALLLAETVGVGAAEELRQRSGDAAGALYRSAGRLWYQTGRFIYSVGAADEEQQRFEEVRVFERDESGRLRRVIEAESARRVAPRIWRFEEATLRSFDSARPGAAPRHQRAAELELEIVDDLPGQRLRSDFAAVSLAELTRAAESERRTTRLRSVLHQRLTSPLLTLLFALIALPLGLRVEQTRNLAIPAAQGVLVLFLFLMAREYGSAFATQGPLAATLAPWLSLGLFGAYGLWELARVPR